MRSQSIIRPIEEKNRSEVNTSNKLLTVEEASRELRVGRTKVYELLNRGELKCIKIDRSCRIIAASIDTFITRKLQEARNG